MNSKINTALLSYGMSGKVFHGPLLQAHGNFEIKAVYQRSKNKTPDHSFPVVYDVEKILTDSSIELVIVNTPNNLHFEHARMALQAGKHVVVEKPFTISVKEAQELITLARSTGKILSVFQNRRWDGDFLTVRKVVEQNLLGRIVEFECHYDRYRNFIEANTWKEEKAPGTGILFNLGSHMLDQVFVLFGMPDYLDARMGIQRTGGSVDDFYDIRLQYENLNVIVKSSYLVREEMPRYIVHGTEGSFVKYGIDPQEQCLKDGQVPGMAGWGAEKKAYWGKLNSNIHGIHFEGLVETVPGSYLSFYDNVYNAIRNRAELEVKPEQAMKVIQLIEACEQSNQERSAVQLSKHGA